MGKQVRVDVTVGNGFVTTLVLDENDSRAKAAEKSGGDEAAAKSRRPANKARSAQNKGDAGAGDNG